MENGGGDDNFEEKHKNVDLSTADFRRSNTRLGVLLKKTAGLERPIDRQNTTNQLGWFKDIYSTVKLIVHLPYLEQDFVHQP